MSAIPAGQALLQRIANEMGLFAAAYRLGIPERTLTGYLNGVASVPDSILLRAVDLLLDRQAVPGSEPPTSQSTGSST